MNIGDKMNALVIVDVKAKQVNKPYSYIVPKEFEGIIERGSRVIVPFGVRTVLGFVVDLIDEVNSELKEIKEVARSSAENIREYCSYMDKDEFCKAVMNDYQFHTENDTVSYQNRMVKTGGFKGVFSNVIQVKATSKDQYVMSLIEDVNRSYEKIKKYAYKED